MYKNINQFIKILYRFKISKEKKIKRNAIKIPPNSHETNATVMFDQN